MPDGRTGKAYESPLGKLSKLIANLNERFGMNLTQADQIYFVQQKQAIEEDGELRVVGLNNDREHYRIAVEKKADDLSIDRHEANGQLFEAMFDKPGVRELFMKYLASSYDAICDEDTG